MKNDVVVFKNGELEIQVNVTPNDETVWLNREQMAELFNRDIKTIGKHISNIFKEKELNKDVVVAKFATTTKHGAIPDKTQIKNVEYYNLDVIISVGYRVKSQRGIEFRKWATSILKDYMFEGYSINQKRLEALNKTIEIQSRIIASTLELDEQEVLNVIETYADALSLLDDYDYQCIIKPTGRETLYKLSYEKCRKLIDAMNFESDVFGVEREEGKLEGILAAVYQNVSGKELYHSVEEKAANLLYFLVKDHPFVDDVKE